MLMLLDIKILHILVPNWCSSIFFWHGTSCTHMLWRLTYHCHPVHLCSLSFLFSNQLSWFSFPFFFLGSAIGFRLDSLLKLTDTRAWNHKMTLMHYLCKVQVGTYFLWVHIITWLSNGLKILLEHMVSLSSVNVYSCNLKLLLAIETLSWWIMRCQVLDHILHGFSRAF